MTYILFSIVAAYLMGSIPTAYIFGKALKGIDIRRHGSGNVGATNVWRTVGKAPGITVLIIDFLKGFAAVTTIPSLVQRLFPASAGWFEGNVYVLLGAAVISGHIWTVFLRFKGGKGVATTAGVMAALAPIVLLGCFMVWIAVFAVWRYVSLASIASAIALPVFAVVAGSELNFIVFSAIVCLIGVYAHKSNIKRLIQGKEKRIVKVKNS